jgi:hypothetical protein
MRRGAVALTAAMITAGALLTGCTTGPSQVGAAAIVGDTTISIETVQNWFGRVVADRERKERARANQQLDDIGRKVVTEAVRHELLLQAAERENLRINEEEVTELLDELGGPAAAIEQLSATPGSGTDWLLYDENTIRDRVRDQLIALELGRKYFEETSLTYDIMLVDSRDDALAKAREIADNPDGRDDFLEAQAKAGAQVGVDQEAAIATNVALAAGSSLFSVPAGTVLVFFDNQFNGWLVVVVDERSTDSPPDSSRDSVSPDDVNSSLVSAVGLRLLPMLVSDVEVKLNPRFGVWEPVNLEAVENDGERQVVTIPFKQPSN